MLALTKHAFQHDRFSGHGLRTLTSQENGFQSCCHRPCFHWSKFNSLPEGSCSPYSSLYKFIHHINDSICYQSILCFYWILLCLDTSVAICLSVWRRWKAAAGVVLVNSVSSTLSAYQQQLYRVSYACVTSSLMLMHLKHLYNVETRFHCPQTFLSLDLQCRDDVSERKQTFWDWEEQSLTALQTQLCTLCVFSTCMCDPWAVQ